MRFHRFVISDASPYFAQMERIEQHWRSLGWQAVPKEDEPAITDAWATHLEQVPGAVTAPKPSRSWHHVSIAELGPHAEEVEAEFTLKILAAFRRCTSQGERLLAIDWLHSWYYFDPHGAISVATRDEWAMPVLPDIESYNYVAQDYRFGVLTGYDKSWFVTLFGANLLAAFAADPPKQFLSACGWGEE